MAVRRIRKDFLDIIGTDALPLPAMNTLNHHRAPAVAQRFFNGGCFFFSFRSVHPAG
jgi:hypothetical protein